MNPILKRQIGDALKHLKEQHNLGNHGLNKFKEQNDKLIAIVLENPRLFRTLGFNEK